MTIRHKVPDKKNALSILLAAKRDMDYTLSLALNENSAATISRNIHECFRMLGDALLTARGTDYQEHHHVEAIKALITMRVNTNRPIYLIDNLRILRHKINYDGYTPTTSEVEDAVSIAKNCFEPLYIAVLKEINLK